MSIAQNLSFVRKEINDAIVRRSNIQKDCPSASVKLLAVTKTHDITTIKEALVLGVDAIAENRVQEALQKYHDIQDKIEWHLIGHLQTNKARQAVQLFDLIHSVDSERLACAINQEAAKFDKIQDVLIQVNIAEEETKSGIKMEEIIPLAKFIANMQNVRLCGLMIIAPFFADAESARPIFKKAYQLFSELKSKNIPNTNIEWLSMGMSNDYIVAIEEGANMVRIGTGLFGTRQYT